MSKLYFLIFLFFNCAIFDAQNIIPNGDFELGPDSSSVGWTRVLKQDCFVSSDSMLGPDSWTVTYSSPDRLINGQIYCNWDNDNAQSGSAFIVFAGMEAGKTTLLTPLDTDSVYRLTCYFQYETFRGLSTGPNRVTFKFNEEDSIVSPYISNPNSWQYFDTIFMAPSISTQIEIIGIGTTTSAVKIDNISLTKVVPTDIYINPKMENLFEIFPNPFADIINFTSKTNENIEVVLYDLTGRRLFKYTCINTIAINTERLSEGVYLYEIMNEKGVLQKGKVIKQ